MYWEEIGKLLSVLFVGLGGGVGGKWLLDMYREWRKGKRTDQAARSTTTRRERADAIEELTEIIDTLRQDLSKVDVKAETALRNERECERKWIRAVEYIQYVMYEANARGWQLRPFKEEWTDEHRPISLAEDRRKVDDPTRKGPERRGRKTREDQGRVEPHGPTTNSADDSPPPPDEGTGGT